MYATRKGGLQARHVMSPNLSFTYNPNLSGSTYGTYYNTITGNLEEYSYFAGSIYGGVSSHTRAVARLTLDNNLELKMKSKKDTITGFRKFTLFDNIGVTFGYDFAADSLNWQPLSIQGRTVLFSFLDINFRLSFDPYVISNEGRRINQTELQVNNRLMRFSGSSLNVGVNWRLNRDFFKRFIKNEKHDGEDPPPAEPILSESPLGLPNHRPDFRNPWNVTINYTFAYNTFDNYEFYRLRENNRYNSNIVQSINFNVDMNITRKWKIEVATGYDFQQKDFTYTAIKLYRDLHCWEMKFTWIPFGYRTGWEFQINVKASVLQDLKYNPKRDFRDNLY
jgi:hypothetical protein